MRVTSRRDKLKYFCSITTPAQASTSKEEGRLEPIKIAHSMILVSRSMTLPARML